MSGASKTAATDSTVVEIDAPLDTNLPVAHLPVAGGDLLSRYLQEVSRTPLLSAEEERALAIRAFEHKDPKAYQQLVQANLRFVVKIAFDYVRYGAKVLDLIQEGNVGLLKAVQEFNPYKDVRLTTYAVYWIKSYMQDFLLRNWSIVRVGTTAAQKKLFYNLKKEQERLTRQGLMATPRAISMNLGVEESDVKLMQERLSGGDVSLSAPADANDTDSPRTLISKIPDMAELPSDTLDAEEQSRLFKEALKKFVELLDPREQMILKERMLAESPKTLVDIGVDYGITKERARQIEEKIKEKLKTFLATHYPDISVN